MRATTALFLTTAFFGLALSCASNPATAKPAEATQAVVSTDFSAQNRRRPRVRIYRQSDERGVYPSYFPGSNAVRDCTATYLQEYRPSGTVIVPRMNCFWRQP